MIEKALLLFLGICLPAMVTEAQTMAVDMDSSAGIQASLSTKDSAQILPVQFRVSSADSIFSYQFKAAFDTSRFTFIGAQQDMGITGEKNILAKNGGTLIGIFQLQANPPALDTVEFSCSITGTDAAKSVSGDGLIGVLYLKSKLQPDDSATITVSQGSLARFGGQLEPVPSYVSGTYSLFATVNVSSVGRGGCTRPAAAVLRPSSCEVAVVCGASTARFSLSRREAAENRISVGLYALDGKLLAAGNRILSDARNNRVNLAFPGTTIPSSGTCICILRWGALRISRKVLVP